MSIGVWTCPEVCRHVQRCVDMSRGVLDMSRDV